MSGLATAIAAGLLVWSAAHLVYVYGGYASVLKALAGARGLADRAERVWPPSLELPTMTVYIGAKDEADIIETRLLNVVDTKYPIDRLEVIVVADGCVDDTASIARSFAEDRPELRFQLVENAESQGKWFAQNLAAAEGWGDILVSTDAETVFEPDTLTELAAPFADPSIGVVGGKVIYLSNRDIATADDRPGEGGGEAYDAYRNVEHVIRTYEMANGFLMKSDGPCVAYRRHIWQPIEPYEDVDHVVCYFARFAGLESVYAPNAIAYDRANETLRQDVKQRSRMTRKYFLTQWRRWSLRRWLTDPGFSWAIYSHRTARLLSPVWLSLAATSALVLLAQLGIGVLGSAVAVGVIMAAVVAAVPKLRTFALSFLAAQAGFAKGLLQLVGGDRTGRYTPTRKVV